MPWWRPAEFGDLPSETAHWRPRTAVVPATVGCHERFTRTHKRSALVLSPLDPPLACLGTTLGSNQLYSMLLLYRNIYTDTAKRIYDQAHYGLVIFTINYHNRHWTLLGVATECRKVTRKHSEITVL